MHLFEGACLLWTLFTSLHGERDIIKISKPLKNGCFFSFSVLKICSSQICKLKI